MLQKLQKKMTQVSSSDYIDVIVNPTAAWTSGLTTDLNGKGASLKTEFTNFAFKVYKVKQRDIDSISSRSDVDFMTIDDTVKTLGHLTSTTGASAIRNLNGSTNPLDGSGIGIVVVAGNAAIGAHVQAAVHKAGGGEDVALQRSGAHGVLRSSATKA